MLSHPEQLTGCFGTGCELERCFYLLRDHADVKALYWTAHQGRLLFASEIKALFADPTLPCWMRGAPSRNT
ncbi:MAG: hypothetical protein R3F40_00835 [Candidatus Competibacteraceae bacterium]